MANSILIWNFLEEFRESKVFLLNIAYISFV